jgi:hypothetical protein
MPSSPVRVLLALIVLALAVAVAGGGARSLLASERGHGERLRTRGDFLAPPLTPAARAAGLRFAPAFAAPDRAWVLAAIAAARPEAQQLIAQVDGLVEVGSFDGGPIAIGLTQALPGGFRVSFDLAKLDGRDVLQRDVVVLHELGHVIDFTLVPTDLGTELSARVPVNGPCTTPTEPTGSCSAPEERFADTFAKWALRGAVSQAGAGYGLVTPTSLEDWGAPLGQLAAELSLRASS